MSFLDHVSVLILTYNEASNIERTLDALRPFPEIVVLDSESTDETIAIAKRYSNVRLESRRFDTHAAQWGHGLEKCGITRPWVLALDADYVLPTALVAEIAALEPAQSVSGYRASFAYCVGGRRLRASLYPPSVVLYRRSGARYEQTGHTQRVVVAGSIEALRSQIDHDDRKPLSRWFASQQRYAALEAEHLKGLAGADLRPTDRIRLMAWPAPVLVFFYTLLVKRCVLDGWAGWYYVLQRTLAEVLIALELTGRRLKIEQ